MTFSTFAFVCTSAGEMSSLTQNDLLPCSSLELIKPIMHDECRENPDRKWAAQGALWSALETSLRLLHPMMPFVTEELWQRLPGRGSLGPSETETIMLARYPDYDPSLVDEEAERLMAGTIKVVKACRSLRASYNIPNKTLASFFVVVSAVGASDVECQLDDVKTLGKASSVCVNATSVPKTAAAYIVDDELSIFMDVKGLIDYGVEIARLETTLASTTAQIEALEKKMAAGRYELVPEAIRSSNTRRLESLRTKRSDVVAAIERFQELEQIEST